MSSIFYANEIAFASASASVFSARKSSQMYICIRDSVCPPLPSDERNERIVSLKLGIDVTSASAKTKS